MPLHPGRKIPTPKSKTHPRRTVREVAITVAPIRAPVIAEEEVEAVTEVSHGDRFDIATFEFNKIHYAFFHPESNQPHRARGRA